MAGMAMPTRMVVQSPSTSYGVAMPRSHRVGAVSQKWSHGVVVGERALFVVGEGGLWFSLKAEAGGETTAKKNGRRACVGMAVDYYAALGVPRSATKAEIKAAYRELAMKYHPDVNKEEDADERFMEITIAYKLLIHDEKKPLYDLYEYGEAASKGGAPAGGAEPHWTSPIDIFEYSGGGMGNMEGMPGMPGMGSNTQQRSRSKQGEDIRYEVTLQLKEAIFGTEKAFDVTHLETCSICSGSGAKPGSRRKKPCQTCFGVGQSAQLKQTPFGSFSEVCACPKCEGEGQVPAYNCSECRGDGRVRVKRTINVEIPAGVKNGSSLRVRREGHAGPKGGPSGDLYVLLRVKRR